LIYLQIITVGGIIVGNVTVEQQLFFEARELEIMLYHVLLLIIIFALLPAVFFFALLARLHLLPTRRILALRQWFKIGQVFNSLGILAGLSKSFDRAPEVFFSTSISSLPM
jgi:hypothetical protein